MNNDTLSPLGNVITIDDQRMRDGKVAVMRSNLR